MDRPLDLIRAAFEALHSARIKRLEGRSKPGADMTAEGTRCRVCRTRQTVLVSGLICTHRPRFPYEICPGSKKLPLNPELSTPEKRAEIAERQNAKFLKALRAISRLPVQKGGFISAAEIGKIMSEIEDELEQ